MSLLPGQILPPTEPLGRVNADGIVTIDKNWWLLLYNLCLQILGTGTGIPADALIDIETTDVDASNTDAAALRAPVNVATLLATDNLLPDPAVESARLLLALGADTFPITSAELPGGFGGFANPSAKVGLTVVNGSASTAMRSDASPPLDQTIAPTMTATWTYTKAGSGASAAVFNSSSQPSYVWQNTGAAANAKKWEFIAGSNNLLLRTLNDAENAVGNAFNATRSAGSQAISDVSVGNATDNPTFSVLGTGGATLSGSLKVVGNSGFNNTAPISKPTVSGSRGGNAALASLLTALASYGLITDSTTA